MGWSVASEVRALSIGFDAKRLGARFEVDVKEVDGPIVPAELVGASILSWGFPRFEKKLLEGAVVEGVGAS